MPRTRRRNTLPWLLIAQAMISLCGPGHHALDEAPDSAASAAALRDDARLISASDDSCPVCDHLSQANLPPTPRPRPAGPAIQAAPDLRREVAPAAPDPAAARPRAPPSRLA